MFFFSTPVQNMWAVWAAAARRAFFFFPAVILALALAGCPAPVRLPQADLEQAGQNWARFTALSEKAGSGPFNSVLSIRYKAPKENSARFAAYFWGNGASQSPYPVRLDVQGAFGAVIAKIVETGEEFLLYDLENNQAFSSPTSNQAMLRMGMPLPSSLGDLSLLLNGRCLEFFLGSARPDMPAPVAADSSGQVSYSLFSGPRGGELTLNRNGQPVRWTEYGHAESAQGWQVEFIYQLQADLPGPQQLRITHGAGYSINVVVKSLNSRKEPFSPAQLELSIPPGVPVAS